MEILQGVDDMILETGVHGVSCGCLRMPSPSHKQRGGALLQLLDEVAEDGAAVTRRNRSDNSNVSDQV